MWCIQLRQYLKNIFRRLPHRQSSSVSHSLILLFLCSGLFINIVCVVKKKSLLNCTSDQIQVKRFCETLPNQEHFHLSSCPSSWFSSRANAALFWLSAQPGRGRCNTRRMGKQEAGWVRKNRKQEEAAIRWPLWRAVINTALLMLQFGVWMTKSLCVGSKSAARSKFLLTCPVTACDSWCLSDCIPESLFVSGFQLGQ